MSHLNAVKQFREKFHLPINAKPTLVDGEIAMLRVNRLYEEVQEIATAIMSNDVEGILDGLVDLEYILHGTTLAYGFGKIYQKAFERVHEANMKKQRAKSADESKHGTKLDIIKPEGWTPPVLKDLIEGGNDE